ncbi:MAG: NADH-quinone oxidoreductase subunit L [candidate division Zixibacteria bacterium]|nr:NADH-quinone oxidoreductase subunit L [candidate division Zixibacteria bacterium]
MNSYVFLVPLLPLLGFLLNGLLGKKVGRAFVSWVGPGVVGLSFLITAKLFFDLLALPETSRVIETTLLPWIVSGDFHTSLGFLVDPLSIVMMLVVTGVGFLIHVYSVGYMHHDNGYYRYFAYLNLFTFSMLVLVMADNFLFMFLGWEGVGLCSYLLIGFWFEKQSASEAGKKAFVVNRIGDFGFLLAMAMIFWTAGSLNFAEVFENAPELYLAGGGTITAITLLLFLGATGKSAQIPLYVWLPDAMEGPTPVSALIHAATMVTAGVYMVVRCNLLFTLAPASLQIVAIVGAVTAIFAASIGLVQNDIKRVLAYSTVSQIGYMFLACGVGAFAAGIFHLTTHAYFKALLFLGAGSVIHALAGEQDLRKMGNLRKIMPVTFLTILTATLAISGIPLFSGFFSKDEILWKAFSSETGGWLLWLLGFLAAGMTAFYMFRLFFLTFYGSPRYNIESAHPHESPRSMTVPLIILAVLSLVGGYIGLPQSLGGSNQFEHFLAPIFQAAHGVEHSSSHLSTEYMLMALSVAIALLGIFAAWRLYLKNPVRAEEIKVKLGVLFSALLNKWYVDEIYGALVVKPFFRLADLFWQLFDVKIVDGSVNAAGKLVSLTSQVSRRLQTGFFRSYAVVFSLGVIALLAFIVFG